MRNEACKTCQNYTVQPEDQRTGREWMNATGWCELPRLSTKRRRIDEDNWCDQYSERSDSNRIVDKVLEDEVKRNLEDAEADSFAVETSKSFEHWRLTIREKVADIGKQLNELDTLINTPYEDLE